MGSKINPRTGGLVSTNLTPPSGGWGAYFYHSDHLGSSSLITDLNGEIVQHIEYVPFGETFLEERNGNWHTPYLFNGKERDEETGLHYYGARYYDSRTSMWLSVDPLAEKYPGRSSYEYCLSNPVRFIDPDGRSTHTNNDGKVVAVYKDKDKGIYRHSDEQLKNFDPNKMSLGKVGAEKMGVTLMWNSFTTRGSDNKPAGKINFGSYEARNWIDNLESELNNMIAINDWDKRMTYASKAGNGDIYDYKTLGLKKNATDDEKRMHLYRGSQISQGVYVSGRDVGNFAAGSAARITHQDKMDFMLTAGGFQLSGNSKIGIMFNTEHWKNEALKAGPVMLQKC